MKKNEVRDLIFAGLNEILSKKGFRQKKTADHFVRKIGEGWQRIDVGLWDYNPLFRFSLGVSIRIDAIEDVVAGILAGPDYYPSPDGLSTYTPLAYFAGTWEDKYDVVSAEDIARSLSEVKVIVEEKIFPFLDELMTIGEIERAVNGDATDIYFGSFPRLAYTRIAAAYLASPSRFESAANKCERELEAANFNKPQFDRVRKLIAALRAKRAGQA
jgi:hypothetical protein